jgi:lysophospholipid acyltransferase (LPLAT)-like uncharacterized protein
VKPSLVLIPLVGALVIRVLAWTWRLQVRGREHLESARQIHPHIVFALWHGRLLPFIRVHRGQNAHVLASEHEDGELLARTIGYFGFGHVHGSSTRGGTKAILALAEASAAGHDVGVTVDGPRGPRFEVKPGVVEVAKLTGCAMIPATTSSRRHRVFRSWDAFELPAPFTRVIVTYGPPVIVPRDAGRELMEGKRRELEQSLRAITEASDRDARA